MRRVLGASLALWLMSFGLAANEAKANFCLEWNRCANFKMSFTIPSFYFGWYCPPANCSGPACGHGHGFGHGHGISFGGSGGYGYGYAPSEGDAYGFAGQSAPYMNPAYAYYYGNMPYNYAPQASTGAYAGASYPTPAAMPNFYQPAACSVTPFGNVDFRLTGYGR